MKQMYGDLFHDICVYSDVCNLLADHHYHIQARRYMHELFLDAPFKEVIVIIMYILCRIVIVSVFGFFLSSTKNLHQFLAAKVHLKRRVQTV